jgi:hypothetical protein
MLDLEISFDSTGGNYRTITAIENEIIGVCDPDLPGGGAIIDPKDHPDMAIEFLQIQNEFDRLYEKYRDLVLSKQ